MKSQVAKKGGIIFAVLIILAGIVFSVKVTAGDFVYVDDGASGEMDGSGDHPFDSIQDAIDEAKKEDKDVKIRKGEYEENIEIWEDVEVYGSDKDEVKIIAKDDDEPVVEMYHDTAIRNVTVREGEVGIKVREGSLVLINECQVYDNDEDGIRVDEADVDHKKEVVIINSEISGNDWTGIYSENRKLKIENNTIIGNDKDGIDIAGDSEGKIEDNDIKHNDGVGIKLEIDGSELYIEDNTIRNNDRDGIEIKTKGERGYIEIKENKLYKNERWGIARVEKQWFADNDWAASLRIFNDNIYWDNEDGGLSPIIKVW